MASQWRGSAREWRHNRYSALHAIASPFSLSLLSFFLRFTTITPTSDSRLPYLDSRRRTAPHLDYHRKPPFLSLSTRQTTLLRRRSNSSSSRIRCISLHLEETKTDPVHQPLFHLCPALDTPSSLSLSF